MQTCLWIRRIILLSDIHCWHRCMIKHTAVQSPATNQVSTPYFCPGKLQVKWVTRSTSLGASSVAKAQPHKLTDRDLIAQHANPFWIAANPTSNELTNFLLVPMVLEWDVGQAGGLILLATYWNCWPLFEIIYIPLHFPNREYVLEFKIKMDFTDPGWNSSAHGTDEHKYCVKHTRFNISFMN